MKGMPYSIILSLASLCVASSALAAQESAPAMHGIDVPCPDSIVRAACPLADVPLVQLLATPERFGGRHVRVIGFVHLEFEGNAAYLHREDYEANLTRNAIWVDFRPGTLTAKNLVNNRYVLLEGVFDARDQGHMGMFSGTLRDISRAEPWPSGKEIRRQARMHVLRVPVVDTAGNHLAGCYHLALGPWSQRSPLGPPSPTEIFRLDTTPINNGSPGARVAARVIPAVLLSPADPRARWLRPAWWRTIGADSIEIVTWSATTEAEVFYGHVAGDELRGVLRRTSDAIPMDPKTRRIQWDAWPWARATARRVACP